MSYCPITEVSSHGSWFPAAVAIVFCGVIHSHAAANPRAWLAKVTGQVTYQANGQPGAPAQTGQELSPGDKLEATGQSNAVIAFQDGSEVQLDAKGSQASFMVEDLSPALIATRVNVGTLRVWVKKLPPGQGFETRTPTAVAAEPKSGYSYGNPLFAVGVPKPDILSL